MAATVTGTFKILDRASRPMEGMRKEAERLDKALLSVGDHMDDVGTQKQLSQMDKVSQSYRDLDRNVDKFGGSNNSTVGRTRSNMNKLGSDSDNLTAKLGRLAGAFSGVSKIMGAMKIPALIAGVVALVQAVQALVGGAVALLPQLTAVSGVMASMPAAMGGVALAAVTVKLAFSGMSAAIKGTKGAMGKLTPEARAFVNELKALKPLGKELQSSAQAGLLPGLGNALGTLTNSPAVGVAKRLLKGIGQTLGGTAEQAAKSFTEPKFLKDLESLGQQGEHLMSRLGSALINVAHALVTVAVAAEPLTKWMGEVVQQWSVGIRESTALGARTGSLKGFFDRTRASLELFGHILHNLWEAYEGVTKAAEPLGESLWGSAEKATKKWAEFANSIEGQTQMSRWFEGLHESIDAIFNLVGDLTKALFTLSQSNLPTTANNLAKAIEPLQTAFEVIGKTWAPVFAETLSELAKLFEHMSTGSGGLVEFVKLFDKLLSLLNGLLEAVPGLNNLLTVVLAASTFAKITTSVGELATKWGLVASEAGAAKVAQQEATAAGMASPGIVPAGGGAAAEGAAAEEEAAAAGVAGGSLASRAGGALRGLGGLRGAAKAGLAAAGKFIAPAYLAFGAANALTVNTGDKIGGSFGNRVDAALDPFSMFQSGPTSYSEIQERAAKEAGSGLSPRKTRRRISNIQQELKKGGISGFDEFTGGKDASFLGLFSTNTSGGLTDAERDQLQARLKALQALSKEQTKIQTEQAKEAGGKAAMEFAQAWNIYAKHGGGKRAAEEMIGPITNRLQAFTRNDMPGAAKSFSTSMLAMLQTAKANNPKLAGTYHQLEKSVEYAFQQMDQTVQVVNGKIYTGSQEEWGKIEEAISSPAERARERTNKAFTAIQEEAVGSLVAMGYTRAQATNIVADKTEGHPTKTGAAESASAHHHGTTQVTANNAELPGGATGMRIPGQGRKDTVPLVMGMAAPGELIVNGWTENDVDRDLRQAGKPTLGARVARERRPHDTFATGGRTSTAGGSVVLDSGVQMTEGVEPQIMADLRALSAELHQAVYVISGYRSPAHSVAVGGFADDPHTRGEAADIGIGGPSLESMNAVTEAQLHAVGLDRPFWPADPHEVNHVQLLSGGATGKLIGGLGIGGLGATGSAAARIKRLKRPKSGLGGAPGALADRAADTMATALEGKINKRIGARGGSTGGSVPSTGGAVIAQIGRGLLANGLNRIGAAGIIGNALQESGWNPGAIGSGGGGLWGFTSSPYSLSDLQTYAAQQHRPWDDAGLQTQFLLKFLSPSLKSALNSSSSPGAAAAYFMNNWERPAVATENQARREEGARQAFASGYSTGGRLPSFGGWFRDGGTITASGPTLLGIGDNGPGRTETARITHGDASDLRPIRVNIGAIHNHRPGDIKQTVKEEVGAALKELSDELDVDFEADEALI